MPRLRRLLLNLTTAACLFMLPLISISHHNGHDRFVWTRDNGVAITTTSHLTAPLLALLLPTARLLQFLYDTLRETRRDYRLTHYICLTCGYDFRHTPDRCPECGTLPPSSRLHADA
jgi:hypothetical protein